MFNRSNNFIFTNIRNEKKKKIDNIKRKILLENSNSTKYKANSNNNNNIISFKENENSRNIKKNNIKIKKDTSEEINKKENKSNDFKSKSFFGDFYIKDLSKENNLFNNNKNSLLQENPFFSNEDNKNLFSGSCLFGDNSTNNNNNENIGISKRKRKNDSNSSSSSACKKKKKKKYSENSSGYLGDSESDSIEKKIKNKVTKKKKIISKKENKSDDENNSSSNYHPEAHNFLAELLPYMSSDSEIESLNKSKINNSEKSNDDEIKKEKEKEKENLNKKEDNVKEDEKENVIYDDKNNEKSSEKEDETENEEKEEEEKEEKNKIIELNEKYKNTKNISSISYYTKKVKINKEDILPSYNFIELKNSDDILYTGGIYDCKNKKEKLKIKYNFEYSEIIKLKDNYFIYADSFERNEIIIFHFEEFNTKMIIDQKMDLPENIEYDPDGPPIAPHLYCIPLNENFIIFQWSRNNNFYIYKNNSKEKNKFKFEQYENIKLNKKAFVYINTSLKKILKINENEFCIFSKSDQRPEPRFLFEAFMQGNKRHKEATYIAVYSFNSSKAQFELKKSKLNYEKGVDYGFNIQLLRKRFIFYDGNMQKRRGKLVQVFDLETMQIISIFKNMEIQFYPISDKNDIFFIIKNSNIYEQYQINNNGLFKKIGEVKLQNLWIERKYKNGILYKGNKSYYLLKHE